jgi:hypothetical protein
MIRGNKGEWSEIYALFKILGEKKLFAGNADLNKIESLFYPIIKILRNESDANYEYTIEDNIVIITGDAQTLQIPVSDFLHEAYELLNKIKSSNGVFSIPDTEEFMNAVRCRTLKANSHTKSDILIVLHDQRIGRSAKLGFSIKSQLGGKSTLLNASKSTNFIYQINNFIGSTDDIARINSITCNSKIIDRIQAVSDLNGQFTFVNVENNIFESNLVLIDSCLPQILASLLLNFFTSQHNKLSDLTISINELNPIGYNNQNNHSFYEYKIKRFLTDTALGMMPSKVWSGQHDATGGYLIVKQDGDVLCYHIYNRNEFEDYLFKNTKFETPSCQKHDFGYIYCENDNLYFKLNLQIRFT